MWPHAQEGAFEQQPPEMRASVRSSARAAAPVRQRELSQTRRGGGRARRRIVGNASPAPLEARRDDGEGGEVDGGGRRGNAVAVARRVAWLRRREGSSGEVHIMFVENRGSSADARSRPGPGGVYILEGELLFAPTSRHDSPLLSQFLLLAARMKST